MKKKGFHKLAVNFPDEVFKKIKSRATKAKRSLSDEAIDLIRCGILDVEDLERSEYEHYPMEKTL
jgi:plasmid stability protein